MRVTEASSIGFRDRAQNGLGFGGLGLGSAYRAAEGRRVGVVNQEPDICSLLEGTLQTRSRM